MSDERFALDLARRVADAVRPLLGADGSRERVGTAAGGDPTFAIDAHAERVAAEAFAERDDVAFFTEDEGLVVKGAPGSLFLVDPIDGTRPSAVGFETCCVSVAVSPYGTGVTLGDVTYGVLVELATGFVLEARRGKGTASNRRLRPSRHTGLRGMFWAGGMRGQPAVPTATVLEELFDAPESEGAFFDQGSAAYSLACVATGRLDAFVDVGRTIVEEVPGAEERFRALGGGSVLNTTTYDTAAGILIATETGCIVSDGLGHPLENLPLLDADGQAETVATIAAGTPELHAELVAAVGRGLQRLRRSG